MHRRARREGHSVRALHPLRARREDAGAPDGCLARRALPTRRDPGLRPRRGPAHHHVAALAIDVAAFEKDDGTRLEVRRDWRRHRHAHTCEDGAPEDDGSPSQELRGILCEIAPAKVFHEVLTPNYDARHWDHFHLEVMRHAERTIVE